MTRELTAAAQKFASFVLVVFEPWDVRTELPPGALSYDRMADVLSRWRVRS